MLALTVFILFILWIVPVIGIWALNGLFGLGIEQSLSNWGYFWLVKLTLTAPATVNRK